MTMSSVNEAILNAVVRHQIHLQRLSTQTVQELVALLRDSELDILERISRKELTEFSLRRLNTILAEIRELNRDAYDRLNNEMGGKLTTLAEYEAGFTARLIEKALPVKITMTQPSIEQLHAILTSKPMQGRFIREELEEKNNLNEVQESFNNSMKDADATENMLDYNGWRAFRIWKGDRLLLKSVSAPDPSIPKKTENFSFVTNDQGTWRIYTENYPQNGASIEVWENLNNRNSLYHQIFSGFIKALTGVIPLSILLLLVLLRTEFQKIRGLILQIRNRAPDSLEPLTFKSIPQEIKPLLEAINNLIARVKSSLERERLFINSAAHELKTPLTALSLQAQLLPESDTAQSIHKTLARATHLVNQLLILARVGHHRFDTEHVSLHEVLSEILAERALIASHKDLAIYLGEDHAPIIIQRDLLKILLGTFIDNAMKYTPEGGSIHLHIHDHALQIEDSGQGIPELDIPKVFDKFYRGSNATQEDGSGLGLSIAKDIADSLNITLTLGHSVELGGLSVRLDFPAETI